MKLRIVLLLMVVPIMLPVVVADFCVDNDWDGYGRQGLI